MLKIELNTSKLVSPIIQDPSIGNGGWKEIVSLSLIRRNSSVSSGFVCLFNNGSSNFSEGR